MRPKAWRNECPAGHYLVRGGVRLASSVRASKTRVLKYRARPWRRHSGAAPAALVGAAAHAAQNQRPRPPDRPARPAGHDHRRPRAGGLHLRGPVGAGVPQPGDLPGLAIRPDARAAVRAIRQRDGAAHRIQPAYDRHADRLRRGAGLRALPLAPADRRGHRGSARDPASGPGLLPQRRLQLPGIRPAGRAAPLQPVHTHVRAGALRPGVPVLELAQPVRARTGRSSPRSPIRWPGCPCPPRTG